MESPNVLLRDFRHENGVSPLTSATVSPSASSTNSDSPTPTNSIHEKIWAARYQCMEEFSASEEQRQLLGTEEESSDKHSSDGESESGYDWSIMEEQHKYYETQFRSLQPDINGLVSGSQAKEFFEKSRLPVEELRKIWQLSDVTKDGALSLAEFKIAMHLVVSRRNEIPLPDNLPQPLVSSVSLSLHSPALSNMESATSPHPKSKEWTRFVDSPTSTLSSPGPKPVNFDFQKSSIEQNPRILHPVPVRVTPNLDGLEEVRNDLKRISLTDTQLLQLDVAPIKPIQRPQPKKHAVPGPGAIPPPPQQNMEDPMDTSGPTSLPVTTCKKEPPPPPPPRPSKTHIRSSSLDLTKHVGRTAPSWSLNGVAPLIPPRISPGSGFTNTNSQHSQLGSMDKKSQFANSNLFSKHGAFHAYRKNDGLPVSTPDDPDFDYHELSLEEKNKFLRSLCAELQEELTGLREERIALQKKLERLHARSSPK